MLLWQPIPEIGFWCQPDTLLMPVVDGVGAKMKYLADKYLNKPSALQVNSSLQHCLPTVLR